jgi:hypothetical protein
VFKSITLPSGKNCLSVSAIEDTCEIGKGKDIVFLGDSHLISLVNVFLEDEISKSFKVIPMLAGECFPLLGFKKISLSTGLEQKSCSYKIQKDRFELIKQLEDPVIIVGGRLPLYLSNGKFHKNEVDVFRPFISSDNWPYEFAVSVERYIKSLAETSSKLILVYPIPEFGFDQKWLYEKGIIWGTNLNTVYDSSEYSLRSQSSFDLLDQVTGDNVFRIYPSNYVCDKQLSTKNSCSPFSGGEMIYADDDHLNSAGASLLLDDLKVLLNQ